MAASSFEIVLPADVMQQMTEFMALSEEDLGVNGKWGAIEKFLLKRGYIRLERGGHVSKVLVDPENRCKLMLIPQDAHLRLVEIKCIGCKNEEIERYAIANEMSPIPERRKEILEANVALVARSGGLLAPVQGDERI